jgi:hypothetical protein
VDWRDSSRHQATFRAEAGSWQRVITDFLRRTGNLKLAQMLAGHADIDHREDLRPSPYNRPQDRATGAERGRHMTMSHLQGLWRRRESNPRKISNG